MNLILLIQKCTFFVLGDTMFIQVNTNSYLSAQNANVSPVNGKLAKDGCKEEDGAPLAEDGAVMLDDDDLNVSYNCDTCNKPVKGKVMLQVSTLFETINICLNLTSSCHIVLDYK